MDICEKLAQLDNDELFDFIETVEITDEQAADSEYGGDTDAEDDKVNETVQEISTRSATTKAVSTSQEIFDETVNFDSDDDVADPSFILDDTPSKRQRLYESANEDAPSTSKNRYKKKKKIDKVKRNFNDMELPNDRNEDIFTWNISSEQDPESFNNFSFSERYGPKIEVNLESPIEIFNSFFDVTMKRRIVNESNRYASQNGKTLNLCEEELDTFFAILIIMGFHKLPSIRMYWCNDPNLYVKRIADVMPLKRFLNILRFLHVSDNENMPSREDENYDKLYKVRPLIEHLNKQFQNNFDPSRNLSIDESMIAFKGRTTLKQYMPNKPIKRGFKVWALACSATGYLFKFSVYEGKSSTDTLGTLGERTVLELSSPFAKKGYCLFFDNFFSTVPLLQQLHEQNLYGCGTVRVTRRHLPKDIFIASNKMKLGEYRFASTRNDISLTVWKDRGNKPVSIVTNMHNPATHTVVRRTNKQGRKEEVRCPLPVFDYNRNMGGVDHFDQLLECYSIARKSRRWWLKIFYYLLDCSFVNSYIIYKHEKNASRQKSVPQIQFRSILANQLIGNFCGKSKRRPKVAVDIRSNKMKKVSGRTVTVENSFSNPNIGEHLPTTGTRRRCAYCSTRQKPKRTTMVCSKCNVALHASCFAAFHKVNL